MARSLRAIFLDLLCWNQGSGRRQRPAERKHEASCLADLVRAFDTPSSSCQKKLTFIRSAQRRRPFIPNRERSARAHAADPHPTRQGGKIPTNFAPPRADPGSASTGRSFFHCLPQLPGAISLMWHATGAPPPSLTSAMAAANMFDRCSRKKARSVTKTHTSGPGPTFESQPKGSGEKKSFVCHCIIDSLHSRGDCNFFECTIWRK